MAFMFHNTPNDVARHYMEDDFIWVAPRSWVKTKEVAGNLADDAYKATLYNVFSPDCVGPIDTAWIIDSEYGYRLASDDESLFLDNYLASFV